MANFQARRVAKGKRFVVEVTDLDTGEVIARPGGTRAERAQAVILARWPEQADLGVYGLRGDLLKAQAEAANLQRTERQMRQSRYAGGGTFTVPLNPAAEVAVVRVEDAA